jgi:pimeloyl-ACP methyl ester carboxylesterase
MYDLTRHGADTTAYADAPPALPRPSLLLTALEVGRFSVELSSSLVVDALVPAPDEGQGRPVLVFPGFFSPDAATRRCRSHLDRLGYRAHGWGLGRNVGLTDEIIDGVLARLEEVHTQHGEPVSVVGWSFGGLLARWVAHQRPDLVRQVVCLGSPYRPEGEHTRTTPLFERTARTHGLSTRALEVVETLRRPLPVPVTAIWSKTDGIVNWRGCALDESEGTNVAVLSSHVGLLSNPLALAALSRSLRPARVAA